MRVVGLDLSLTKTGVADETSTRTVSSKARGMERLVELREAVLRIVFDGTDWPTKTLIVIEGYSMGTARQNSHAHALGELGGVVRVALHEHSVPFVDVPPASLKKYATGKGNANKGMVLEAASKRSGLDFEGDDNRADAWWLWAMAFDAYGEPVVEMPVLHRSALGAVAWPEAAVLEALAL